MLPTPADLRAQIARIQMNRYVLAGLVGVHPGRRSLPLWGKLLATIELLVGIYFLVIILTIYAS